MDLKARRPRIEIAAEWIAALCLGAAAGFAALSLTAAGLLGAVAVAMLSAAAALVALGLVDRHGVDADPAFEPVAFPDEAEPVDFDKADVLILEDEVEDDALLLDTPVAAEAESRVVRLFGGAAPASEAGNIPAPGEMLARIEDFLGVARGSAEQGEPVRRANEASADASAALHAALADIRRSLRQG
jgi:hypothetical protein